MFLHKKNSFFQQFSRKEGLNIFFLDKTGHKTHITIGILGCDYGVGTTHLAIALCSYCASKQKKSCAYLELHSRNEISQLVSEQVFDTSHKQIHFRLHGIDYYPAVKEADIPSLLNLGYEYFIMDIGTPKDSLFSEFLRCDRKLVLGSLAPWKVWKYEALFHQLKATIHQREGCDYLAQTGTAKEILHFSKAHRIHIQPVPFIKNPFSIEKELFPFLGTLSAEP